jgi:release factor glutamine methyltransferase
MVYQEIYPPSEDSYFMSEILERIIPNLLKKNSNIKFLEMGCGSGIQLQTASDCGIKKENIFGADINVNAVNHCKNLGFKCIHSNLFSAFKGKFDLIVFNPPYLPDDKKEPADSKIATTGGKKGGELINKFLRQARKHLTDSGRIILLVSSLTKSIDFSGYNAEVLGTKKMFFEELKILELS